MKPVEFNFLRFYIETRYEIGFNECPRSYGSRPVQRFLQKVAKYHSVKVERDASLGYDNALAIYNHSGTMSYIVLGEFLDSEKETLAFFHELGHILAKRQLSQPMYLCKAAVEGMAWELGLDAAYRLGLSWELNDPALLWAIECFRTYRVEPSIS